MKAVRAEVAEVPCCAEMVASANVVADGRAIFGTSRSNVLEVFHPLERKHSCDAAILEVPASFSVPGHLLALPRVPAIDFASSTLSNLGSWVQPDHPPARSAGCCVMTTRCAAPARRRLRQRHCSSKDVFHEGWFGGPRLCSSNRRGLPLRLGALLDRVEPAVGSHVERP